jgi:hypothetical protein
VDGKGDGTHVDGKGDGTCVDGNGVGTFVDGKGDGTHVDGKGVGTFVVVLEPSGPSDGSCVGTHVDGKGDGTHVDGNGVGTSVRSETLRALCEKHNVKNIRQKNKSHNTIMIQRVDMYMCISTDLSYMGESR